MEGDLHTGAYVDTVLNLDVLAHDVGVPVDNHALLPLTDGHTNQNKVEHLVILAHGQFITEVSDII